MKLTVHCKIDAYGATTAVHLADGDGRALEVVRQSLRDWRWRFPSKRYPQGALAGVEFSWSGGRSTHKIVFFQAVAILSQASTQPFRAENTGEATWSHAVGNIAWTGWYRMLLQLDSDGSVRDVKLLDSPETGHDVAAFALQAAREWRFSGLSDNVRELTLSLASAEGVLFTRYAFLHGIVRL